jgi:hypothetical protein
MKEASLVSHAGNQGFASISVRIASGVLSGKGRSRTLSREIRIAVPETCFTQISLLIRIAENSDFATSDADQRRVQGASKLELHRFAGRVHSSIANRQARTISRFFMRHSRIIAFDRVYSRSNAIVEFRSSNRMTQLASRFTRW